MDNHGVDRWEVLLIVLMTLKIFNLITLSWVWVLAPWWGQVLFYLIIATFI